MQREKPEAQGDEALFAKWVEESSRILFFGGAGVSTESGIPDFRSTDGLYHTQWDYPPEVILSHTFFEQHTELFFRFYRAKMLYPDAAPNAAHLRVAQWEARGKLQAVVTQNIDGLHTRAGNKRVFELHGSVWRNHCTRCHTAYPLSFVRSTTGVPRCPRCGGVVKPDVVLYEESLPMDALEGAIEAIGRADLLIVAGTSLTVQPAAGLLAYYPAGGRKVVINPAAGAPRQGELVLREKVGALLSRLP